MFIFKAVFLSYFNKQILDQLVCVQF